MTRVEVIPGAGAVARFGDTLVWVGRAASHALLSYLTRGAASGASVRQLCDQVAAVLRSGDPEPAAPFAILGPTPQGWVVLVHGPVQCYDGAGWLVPSPAQGWQGKLLGEPTLVLVGAAGSPVPPLIGDSPFHLEEGVVPGGGFYLTRTPVPGATGQASYPAAGSASGGAATAPADQAFAAPPSPSPAPAPANTPPPAAAPANTASPAAAPADTAPPAAPPEGVPPAETADLAP